MLLVASFLMGQAFAQTTWEYEFTSKVFNANGAQNLNGVEWNFAGEGSTGYFGYDGTKGQQFGSKNKPFTTLTFSTNGIEGVVTEVKVNASTASGATAKMSVSVGEVEFASAQDLTTESTDYTFTGSGTGEIKIIVAQTEARAIYVKSISVTYSSSSVAVVRPVATPAGGFYTEAQSVTLSCATENAVIYYTTDGKEPTAESTQYKNAITIDKTTTLKAIAILGEESSSVLTATYTFPEKVADIAAFMAKEVNKDVYYQITGTVTVTAQNGAYLYVTDASGNLLVYAYDLPKYTNGQTFTGLIGTVDEFGGAKQLVPYTPLPEAADGEAVEPTVMTPDEITADDLYAYIKIEGAEIASAWESKDATIKTTDGTLALRDQFSIGGTLAVGSKYDIIAIVGLYNTTVQLLPLSMTLTQGVETEEFTSIAELIEAAPAKANLTCDLTVLYHNGRNLYVRDAAGDNILIYDSTEKIGDTEYTNGQILTGGIVGAYTLFGGTKPELETLNETEMPAAQEGTPVEPDKVNPADLTPENVNDFVSIVNAEIAEDFTFDGDRNLNATIVMGEGTFTIRDSFRNFTDKALTKGQRVDIVGFVDVYDGTAQVYPISIEDNGETTDIDVVPADGVTVYTEDGVLYIEAGAGDMIEIWSVQGQLLYSGKAVSDLTAVSSMPYGVVVVRVNGAAVKAIVR